MGIVLSLHELVEDSDNPPETLVILTPEQEIPAVETPFPSRRKKRHQEKKRRPDTFHHDSSSGHQKKKTKREKSSSGQRKTDKEENISDPCHRLIPAQRISRMSVTAAIRNVKK